MDAIVGVGIGVRPGWSNSLVQGTGGGGYDVAVNERR